MRGLNIVLKLTYENIMNLTQEEQKQYNKFKKLPGCRNWSEQQFIEKAKEQAKLSDPDLNVMGMFSLKEDKDLAKRLLFKYLDDFNIENIAEKNTLKQLIFLEVIQINSIQPQIEDYRQKGGLIPTQIMDAIHKNLREIKDLKLQLGLKTSENDKSDGYKALESMMRKAAEWRRNNQGSRTLCCISKDSKIMMSDFTTKNIQDIKIDDEIIGVVRKEKQGIILKKQKVLNFYDKGFKKVLKLKTKFGKELICTPDHLIYSSLRSKLPTANGQSYFPAENCLRRGLKTLNYINDIEKYYKGSLLGFIESDGSEYTQLHEKWNFETKFTIYQSAKTELNALEFLLNHFNIGFTKSFDKKGLGDGCYVFRIKTKHSGFIKNIKKELFLNKDIAIGFLAGFILGDGTIDKLGNAQITQKNKNELLKKVFKYLNVTYTENTNFNGNKCSTFGIRKQIPLIFENSTKSVKYLNGIFSKGSQHNKKDEVISLELLPEEQQVYDLTTETHNFIANGIIVHNCPHCGQMTLLKIRTNIWEAQKHPFFKDRVLHNKKAIELYKQGKITKMDLAQILDEDAKSTDYVDWILEKIEKTLDKQDTT